MDFTVWDGADEVPVDLAVWDGTRELPAIAAGTVQPGYRTFEQMLAQEPFYVAHRGGSGDFPEGSLFAYTQSVAHGVPALELSVARTLDGVWISLHDETINRTSGTTGLPPASAMTWAEIQQHPIRQHGRVEPYARVDEILQAYSGSHLFFVDPKYQAGPSRVPELFALLKSFPGWERHVVKFSYSATALARAARAAGFRTWGYYYEADADLIAETEQSWDLLGMAYSASQHAWDLALEPGKPVVGHICPTLAAARMALAKGADGLMCSGVRQIVPGPSVFGA